MTIRFEDVASSGGGASRRHLFGPFWSTVEHVPDRSRHLWTWAVVRDDADVDPVAEGFAYGADDAETAVDEWARRHRPRGWWHRVASALRRT